MAACMPAAVVVGEVNEFRKGVAWFQERMVEMAEEVGSVQEVVEDVGRGVYYLARQLGYNDNDSDASDGTLKTEEGYTCEVHAGASAVKKAWWGQIGKQWTDKGGIDVTDMVKHLLADGTTVKASVDNFSDPSVGRLKALYVLVKGTIVCDEGYSVPVPGGASSVKKAWWGEGFDANGVDVTEKVKECLAAGPIVEASNSNFGDPCPKVVKTLYIIVRLGSEKKIEKCVIELKEDHK